MHDSAPKTSLPISSEQGTRNAASPLPLDPRAYARGLSCVHCGLCLPVCPTYTETGHEADSPRGRIQLMLALADQQIAPTPSVRQHLDLCLDCRACETACPSGVIYHELIEDARLRFTQQGQPVVKSRLLRWIFFHLLTRPDRLKWAILPARLMQKIGLHDLLRRIGAFRLLPSSLGKMVQMLPDNGRLWPQPLPEILRARRTYSSDAEPGRPSDIPPVKRVAFFAGCVGSVMFDTVNRQAVELLAAAGCDVVVPPAQTCCGAIHHHNGDAVSAEEMARRNIDTFLPENAPQVDVIVTTIAGCGAMLREYDVLLRDDPKYAARARDFVAKVRDVTEVLAELKLPAMPHRVEARVTYHDACHLAHAQRVTAAPRRLLAQIPGIRLVPLPESDMCCGAAGTYNLTQPEMATRLAERKLRNIDTTGASICAAANVGCAMHIQSQAAARGTSLKVVHPVELLHQAVFGGDPVTRHGKESHASA